jgi:hypothetical protein
MNRVLTRAFGLCLAVALLSQPAFSAGSPVRQVRKEPGFLTAVRQVLLTLVPSLGEAHGTMDSNGSIPPSSGSDAGTPSPPTTETDAHGTMDPDGGS